MATSRDDFAIYCCDLLSGVGRCSSRRMFGGHGISTDGLTFALVADLGGGEKLWLKADAETAPCLEAEGCERFSYPMTRSGKTSLQSMNYYSAPEETMESPALMLPWARLALESAVKARPVPKKPKAAAATKKLGKPGKKLRP